MNHATHGRAARRTGATALVAAVRDVLRAAGAREVRTVRPGEETRADGLVVHAGDRAAERALRNHVVLGWAVSPGQSMCLASGDDRKALLRKIDAMAALGVRAFQLRFEDASYTEWHCDADAERYGTGPEAAATAQAEIANEVAAHLAERYGFGRDAVPLSVLPTEFYQDGPTEYRDTLAEELDADVEVAWTGVGVVPATITGGELARAHTVFRRPLVTMDNYPVNDYAGDRVFLGPYTGREPAVANRSAALLANAMEQATASRLPLFTVADYAWNPRGYRPRESWRAAVEDLAATGGGETGTERSGERARRALHVLAANNSSSVLDEKESAYLAPLLDAFWKARAGGDGAGAWKARLELQRLRAEARESGVTVGEDVLPAFVDRALKAADDWSGAGGGAQWSERSGERVRGGPEPLPGSPPEHAADGDPATAFRAAEEPGPGTAGDEGDGGGDELVLRLPRARSLAAVTVQSEPGAGTRAAVEARVPGEGWRRLGALSGEGWTEVDTGGLRADAVRLVWQDGSMPPVIHELTPWYSDSPGAGLELSREEANAVIGGEPAAVGARLTGHRPTDVLGRLTVRAPEGFTVRAPRRVTLRRGVPAAPEIEISAGEDVRPGTYRIPVTLTAEGESLRRTLAVRAYPPTGGPDLARGAKAGSSADETGDFPASAATDGDPGTRWSSPAEDGQWLRVELDRPARIGEVRLHWQDAYASLYRVQVSADGADGRAWSTAATVRDGRGGRETVRMDAPAGTRYVRIVADERATRFGVSLWSLEAYAVQEPERDEEKAREGTGERRERE
ncbi:beta-N-acetylglucosaminidase domain-containing protein [Streptomyces sp. CNQ085]|uniref:beta-N-acetylglucosaminidase domain-containing protein n=1 Tax=Streptomyces sp. CNQ085 TaxID=2886944 RepID=UPI001F509B0B|nr:beta-N-acetylglucosaminidase domain-containing protein [Streptomyces sp. CNQ085]MCI0383226.1 beta-N-acetylglucosaminidase domain-containing protein [Streptomyces sp. CNQ085]